MWIFPYIIGFLSTITLKDSALAEFKKAAKYSIDEKKTINNDRKREKMTLQFEEERLRIEKEKLRVEKEFESLRIYIEI